MKPFAFKIAGLSIAIGAGLCMAPGLAASVSRAEGTGAGVEATSRPATREAAAIGSDMGGKKKQKGVKGAASRPASRPAKGSKKFVPFGEDDGGAMEGEGPAAEAPELMLFKEMPIVVAAGKREQTQQQAAASVSVIDADEISLFGYRDLADVLRDQRSFNLNTDGLNWFAGVRGFLRPGEWNARLLVLVDGRPTRENIYGQTHLDQDFVVPMEAVQRVEIVRGPGSALYGSNAVFAVINVVTKNGGDVNGAQLTLQAGTLQTARASLLVGEKLANGWDVIANVSGYTSQGDRDIKYDGVRDADHNFGHIRNSDYEGADAAFIKARKDDFTLQLDLETRQRDNRAGTYQASWFNPGSMHEERSNVTARYDRDVDGQSLHAMVYYGHYAYDQSWGIDGEAPDRYTSRSNNDWIGEEIHYGIQLSPKLHLLAGAEGDQALFTDQHDHTALGGDVLNINPSYNSWGVFAEVEYKATKWLTLVGGMRFDEVQRISPSLSPRLAALFSPTKEDTIKAMYGRAFRAPNLYEQFYASPGGNTPNPNLRAETVDTFELAWEHQTKGGWHSSLGYYYWTMSNAMDNITLDDGSVQTQNIGHIEAQGVEAEIQKRWKNGAEVRAYATLDEAVHGGEQLTHSPQWIVGGAFDFPLINDRTFLAIEPQIVGPMKSDLGQSTNATFITNVVFTSRNIVKGLDFQLGAYNLFAKYARLPHSDSADNFQPTLNYPSTELMASLIYRF